MSSIARSIMEHEETGAALYHTGRPLTACRSEAMRRGWQMAQRETENTLAETSGIGGWYVAEVETTWEAALLAQMKKNRVAIERNAELLKEVRRG